MSYPLAAARSILLAAPTSVGLTAIKVGAVWRAASAHSSRSGAAPDGQLSPAASWPAAACMPLTCAGRMVAAVASLAGLVNTPDGQLLSVMSFTVTGGRIAAIEILSDPARLAALDLTPAQD